MARRYLSGHLKVTQNCFVKLPVTAIIPAGSQSVVDSLAFNLFFILLIFKRRKQIQESLQDVDFLKVRRRKNSNC